MSAAKTGANAAEPAPPVVIEIVPALEVITAAAACSTSLTPDGSRGDATPALPAEVQRWRDGVAASISPFERADLDLTFSTISATLFLFYTVVREGHREAPQLVAHLRRMTDDAFLKGFAELLQLDRGISDILDPAVVEEALERDRARETVPFAQEARRLVSLLASPATFRAKLADVVEWFETRFVADELEQVRGETARRRERLEERLVENPAETLDALSAGNYETLLADRPEVTIFPVHLAGAEHAVMLPGAAYILCGTTFIDAVVPAEVGREEWERRTDELLKAIADPNRLAMLRLLRRRPHYGKELADELGVSPGTASYHLEKLVTARLARIELSQGRRFYYAVNPRGVRDLQECLGREFLAE
jgi:DNA-binding transcriptional ArsR family regulator